MSYSEKIYPKLASAPPEDESQTYRLAKIDELEKLLHDEVAYRGNLSK